jgi:PAS domain S-box-containing protein
MLVGMARVMAERRARTAALEEERRLLEERVHERTADLARQTELALSASARAEEAAAHAEEESVRAEEEAARAEEEQLRAEEEAQRAVSLAEELRQAGEQQRLALQAANMGMWSYDPRSRELTVSDRSRELFGLDGARSPTLDLLLSRVYADDRATLLAGLNRTLREPRGTQTYAEYRTQAADGSERWILECSSAITDGRGQVARVVGVHLDLTDRKRTEDHLRHAELLTSVGRLAGGVAHEVNNQMSVVLGCADFILRRTDLPPVVRTDVQQMLAAAERSAAITAQLLAFSRRQTRRPVVFDLNAVLLDMEAVLRRTVGDGRRVTLRLAPDLWSIRADPGQIGQVLLNLTINARDAMLGGGELLIETVNVQLDQAAMSAHPSVTIAPGAYVRLAVSDTGHGMDRETLRQVFEPFFTTKGVGKGTGLGLSTVYGIVKSSDGYVWAYSEPGQGTTFKIYLPRADGVVSVPG